MNGWWTRHVSWRLVATDRARRMWLATGVMRRTHDAIAQGICTKCRGPRDDLRFKTCTPCRKLRAANARASTKRRVDLGWCSRCPRRLDREGVICTTCVDKQRTRTNKERYGLVAARKGARHG